MEVSYVTGLDAGLDKNQDRKNQPKAGRSSLRLEWCSGVAELRDVLTLRKLCFPLIKEFLSESDLRGRHLVVRNSEGLICGAYRVTLSTEVDSFEAEDDFVLKDLLVKPGIKVELAWACVHPDFRDGRAIHLMWKALGEFFKTHKVRYVFGLASITSHGSEQISDIIKYLKEQKYMIGQTSIQARNGFLADQALILEHPKTTQEVPFHRRLLPSLLRAYLMAGALVVAQPVFDPDLDCYDFMTVLDIENVSSAVSSHFHIK